MSAVNASNICAWKLVSVDKTVSADCANNLVHEFIEKDAAFKSCFGAEPAAGYNRSLDSYIECTFQAMLGVDVSQCKMGDRATGALYDIHTPPPPAACVWIPLAISAVDPKY